MKDVFPIRISVAAFYLAHELPYKCKYVICLQETIHEAHCFSGGMNSFLFLVIL